MKKKYYIQESHEVSPFPDHKAARDRQDMGQRQTRNTNDKKDPHKKHRLGTVSKKMTGGLKHV